MSFSSILIYVVSGLGAGLVTGLIGVSAVSIIAPILIIFLGVAPYTAIGFSLLTDVAASIAATIVYHHNQNINLKQALPLLVPMLIGVIIGSFISVDFPSILLNLVMGVGAMSMGITIMRPKDDNIKNKIFSYLKKIPYIASIFGLILGLYAGVFGAGGGQMIFLMLVFILGYQVHTAIGTSVMAMSVIAFMGGVAHYINTPFSLLVLSILVVSAVIGALISAIVANRMSERRLSIVAGVAILSLGSILLSKLFLDLIY